MLRMIKHFIRAVKMKFCNHDFVLMNTEYNKVSKNTGCGRLWYKCPKCGKMFHSEIMWTGSDSYTKGCYYGIKKRMRR
jgi:hypothetical protein